MSIKPVCFVISPYGIKPTFAPTGSGAPAEIDFDKLWEDALRPALEKLDYEPIRADFDLGAMIIQEMIERLAISDLVIAEVSTPNANVYYEIGIRHAARDRGCVLVSADWAKPNFDIDQMRQIRYPLPARDVDPATAEKIQQILCEDIPKMASGRSPFHTALPKFPDIEPRDAAVFKGRLEQLGQFQARVRKIRNDTDKERAKREVETLRAELRGKQLQPGVALELMYLVRDVAGFGALLEFVDEELSEELRGKALIKEQRALAQSMHTKDHRAAIADLQQLIEEYGPSAERYGLIGGRYKRIFEEAEKSGDKRSRDQSLNQAIDYYERGMYCDLNQYFSACNLPNLYRSRNRKGDEDKAIAAAIVTEKACERARRMSSKDEWLKQTLLCAAFAAGDADAARELLEEIKLEGPREWNLKSTLPVLERSITFVKNGSAEELRAVYDELYEFAG